SLLLLSCDRLLRALTGTSVSLGALATDWQATAVAQSLVGTNLDLATDVGLDFAAEVTLNLPVVLDHVTQSCELLVAQVLGTQVRGDAGLFQQLLGSGWADSEDVGQCDLHALFAWQVYTSKACHMALSFRFYGGFLRTHPGGLLPSCDDVPRYGAGRCVEGPQRGAAAEGRGRPPYPTGHACRGR